MLNSVGGHRTAQVAASDDSPTSPASPASPASPVRRRLSADDRRRQLLGIGLSKLVETPIQDLSMDQIASEAGISRGLLFHYFPTKTDFYRECVAAAGRRILRTTAPDPEADGHEQVRTMLRLMVEQIDRRREFYLRLVHGSATPGEEVVGVYDTLRSTTTDRVMVALGLTGRAERDVVHAWWAYVEDRALTWSGVAPDARSESVDDVVAHCEHALAALRALR
jgi:AcrR family transcriptional regulator